MITVYPLFVIRSLVKGDSPMLKYLIRLICCTREEREELEELDKVNDVLESAIKKLKENRPK